MIREWKELTSDGEVINWRMEEKNNGDREYRVYMDIRMAIPALPTGNPDAPPYVYVPLWPLDPNAPIVDYSDDCFDDLDED